MKNNIKNILLVLLILLCFIFLYFYYFNKNKETNKPVYEQTQKINIVSHEEIAKTIELVYLENKEYIDSLNNDNGAITNLLIRKAKEALPKGASASEIRDEVRIFLNSINQP